MSLLIAIALTTGILSGIWGVGCCFFGLLSWGGFLGCTTYFALQLDGIKGVGLGYCD